MITGSVEPGGLEAPQHLEAVDPGQPHVEQDERRPVLARELDRLLAAAALEHADALLLQIGAHELAQCAVVVDQQHGGVHGGSYSLATTNGADDGCLRAAARLDRDADAVVLADVVEDEHGAVRENVGRGTGLAPPARRPQAW